MSSILQQAVASKEGEWKRRNFLGKRASLHVPSPPRVTLRTCELNNFVCWAVEEVQDYDPKYLALLHSTLHNLVVRGADPAPAGPQAVLLSECNAAEPASDVWSPGQHMALADVQSSRRKDPLAGMQQVPPGGDGCLSPKGLNLRQLGRPALHGTADMVQPTKLTEGTAHRAQLALLAAAASAHASQPQDIDALVAEEVEISRALQSGSPEEPPDFMVEEALSLESPPRTESVDSASPCSSRRRRCRTVSSQSS